MVALCILTGKLTQGFIAQCRINTQYAVGSWLRLIRVRVQAVSRVASL